MPGIELPPDAGFQYLEPPEDEACMRADEYDQLIEDPTGFLFNVWLPRVSADVSRDRASRPRIRNNLSFLKGGMAMMRYFTAFGTQAARLRHESGTVSAISGILKAPFDIIADKLRGYKGLCMDMFAQPDKVLAACEALMPHLLHVACQRRRSAAATCRSAAGCTAAACRSSRRRSSRRFYWPTLKPIIEELWSRGHQTLFYAEGEWERAPRSTFAELPDLSIVYHVDRGDIFEVHRAVGHKFCLSGGIPNDLLAFGTPDEVRALLQEGDRRRGPRRRLHHGRQRDHAGRHEGGEPPRDDRGHAGVRSVLNGDGRG